MEKTGERKMKLVKDDYTFFTKLNCDNCYYLWNEECEGDENDWICGDFLTNCYRCKHWKDNRRCELDLQLGRYCDFYTQR